eukprot:tig00020780_g13776.t1
MAFTQAIPPARTRAVPACGTESTHRCEHPVYASVRECRPSSGLNRQFFGRPIAPWSWTSGRTAASQPARPFLLRASASAAPPPASGAGIDWKKLQNGSDIRGVAVEGVAGQDVNLTDPVVYSIGAAFAQWLAKKKGKPSSMLSVAVGCDSRVSGPRLRSAFSRGLRQEAVAVKNCGIASTPAMFMSTVTDGHAYDGGVMITASHLPFNRNGVKFFTADGGLDKPDITEILAGAAEIHGALAGSEPWAQEPAKGSEQAVDFMSDYSALLVDKIRRGVNNPQHYDTPLQGFRVLVDAGNGAGGFFVEKVLRPLGADVTGSQFLEPDGMFPNHIPNPEEAEAIESVVRAVQAHKADLGIIFDTDVDRAGAVDSDGQEINRNRLIAALSSIVLREHPGSTIVTDSVTSDGLAEFIEGKLGGRHHRFKRGYKNVINEAVRLNGEGQEAWLAIETSGHGAMRENFFLDDGAYLMVKLLVELGRSGRDAVAVLTEGLREPKEAAECRLALSGEDFAAFAGGVLDALAAHAAQEGWSVVEPNYEGIRVSFPEGWFLARKSLHDPILPINIESDVGGGVQKIAARLLAFMERFPTEVDLTPLRKAAAV